MNKTCCHAFWLGSLALLLLGCGSSEPTSPTTERSSTPRVVDSSTGYFSRGGTDSIRAAVEAHLEDSTLFVEVSTRSHDTVWRIEYKGPGRIGKFPVGSSDSSFFMKVQIGEGSTAKTTTCYANTGTVSLTSWTPDDSASTTIARFSGWGIARMMGSDWGLCNFLGFSIQNAPVRPHP